MTQIAAAAPPSLLPPLEEFLPYLEQIWESKWLTNGGPFHQELGKSIRSVAIAPGFMDTAGTHDAVEDI